MNRHEQIEKSRLGRLLVNRGYITESQLADALTVQAEQGIMLGEVLKSQGLITERELERTLRHQKRSRYTAAFIACAVAPLQPIVALATTPIGLPIVNPARMELSQVDMGSLGGLKMLDDSELAGVNAQGFVPGMMGPGLDINATMPTSGMHHLVQEDENYEEQDDEQIAYMLADSALTVAGLGPIANMLEAEVTVDGVKYDSNRPALEILEGGKMRFYMPTSIDRISMEDIRVKGNTSGPTMGSIYMSDIKFAPGSNYTISAKN